MKIAFVAPAHPFRGGIAQFCHVWAQTVARRAHGVKIFTFTQQFPDLVFPGKTQLDPSPAPAGLDIEQVFCAWEPWTWYRTARRLQAYVPDILVVLYWVPFFAPGYAGVLRLLRLLRLQKEILTAISIHNAIPHESWPLAKTLVRLILSSADLLLAHSDHVRREVIQLGLSRDRVRHLPHPVYSHYPAPHRTRAEIRAALRIRESRVLLFFGYVKRYKGLDLLLQAMPRILESFNGDIHLLVVGEHYSSRKQTDTEIRSLGISCKVTLVDEFVPDDAVGEYFAAADLLVLPYRTASQSGVLQIAYHFDVPVLATSVGELPAVIEHGKTGHLVVPDDPVALAKGVREHFRTAAAVDFAANIRQRRKEHSWDAMVDHLEQELAARA